MSVKAIRNLIDELREDKLLERIGPAKGGESQGQVPLIRIKRTKELYPCILCDKER